MTLTPSPARGDKRAPSLPVGTPQAFGSGAI